MSQRQSLVTLRPNSQPGRVVEPTDAELHAAYRDWLSVLTWSDLDLLASCTAAQVGSGHELAFTIYDDDGDAAADPFDGVRITAAYRDDTRVVVSRADYDRIVADVCDIAIAHPPDPLPAFWPSFLEHARSIIERADRAA